MTKETREELRTIVNALEYFLRIEPDKDNREILLEVLEKLDVLYTGRGVHAV